MKRIIFSILVLTILLTACGGETTTTTTEGKSAPAAKVAVGADYVGTWERQGTWTNGQKVSDAEATMILTKNSFDSRNDACANSGKLDVSGKNFVMTVEKSDCPSIINVGSVVRSTYSIEGGQLVTKNTEYGAEVMEKYNRK